MNGMRTSPRSAARWEKEYQQSQSLDLADSVRLVGVVLLLDANSVGLAHLPTLSIIDLGIPVSGSTLCASLRQFGMLGCFGLVASGATRIHRSVVRLLAAAQTPQSSFRKNENETSRIRWSRARGDCVMVLQQ